MNTMTSLSTNPWAELLLKVTLLLAAAWLMNAALAARNPRGRRRLWRGTALLLLAAPALLLLNWRLPLLSVEQPPSAAASTVVEALPAPGTFLAPSPTTANSGARPSAAPAMAAAPAISANGSIPSGALIALAWGLGAALHLGVLLVTWGRASERRRHLRKAHAALVERTSRIARDLCIDAVPSISIDAQAASPYLLGLGSPLIVLPEAVASRDSGEDLEAILRHELAHVKGRDAHWVAVLRIARSLWWFHPLVWRMEGAHERACEEVADAIAAGSPEGVSPYVALLAEAALASQTHEGRLLAAPMARSRSEVLHRIAVLQRSLWNRPLGAAGVAVTLLAGAVALILLSSGTAATEPTSTPATPPSAIAAPSDGYAWKAAEFRAPDPNTWFAPASLDATARLRALLEAADFTTRDAGEVAGTFRQGLLGLDEDNRSAALRQLGNQRIWGSKEQSDEIIEVLYQALPLDEGVVLYFGLSTVREMSPNLLRVLSEIAMKGEPNNTSRVLWGTRNYKLEMRKLIEPAQKDPDEQRRTVAADILRELLGGTSYWQDNAMARAAKANAPSADELREIFASGSDDLRISTMQSSLGEVPDDCIPVVLGFLKSSNPDLRTETIRFASRWVWTEKPRQEVIEALLQHQPESNQSEEFHYLVYFGLSVASPKSDAVVERLIEAALQSRDYTNTYSRIVWGMTQYSTLDHEQVTRLLKVRVEKSDGSDWEKAALYFLHRDLIGKAPTGDWGLAAAAAPYLEPAAILTLTSADSDEDALWRALQKNLPGGLTARRFVVPRRGSMFYTVKALIRGGDPERLKTSLSSAGLPDYQLNVLKPVDPRVILDYEALGMIGK